MDRKPSSPNNDVMRDPELLQQIKDLRAEVQQILQVQQAIRGKVQPASCSRLCLGVGLLAAFSFCLLLVMAVYVLLSKPEDQDALETFMGKSWPWVYSFFVFSSFTAAMLWKMESGQEKFESGQATLNQKLDSAQATLNQKLDSAQATLNQKLDGTARLITRQNEENNLVMSATNLVTSKIGPTT